MKTGHDQFFNIQRNENARSHLIFKTIKIFQMKTFLSILRAATPFLLAGLLYIPASAQDFGNSSPVADPFASQYFINPYLANPSMAGIDTALNLNAAYRQQFSGIPGAPVSEAFTADYNTGKRVGLGLIAYNDKAGLISRTRFALTYAYHLPVGEFGEHLHFGISAALVHNQLDPKGIVGDQSDPAIDEFNGRKNAFEVDYGMAYTDPHITIQGSLTNMISFFQKLKNTTADVSTFYAAAAYKFTFDGTVNSIEPQVSIRGVKQYNSIVDAGASLVMFHHILDIYALAHSTGNFSIGVGVNYKNTLYIGGSYLSQTSGLRNYTNGSYEMNIGLTLFKKNK
jgi:type IX secretion system PorP/SprF family membrane protein